MAESTRQNDTQNVQVSQESLDKSNKVKAKLKQLNEITFPKMAYFSTVNAFHIAKLIGTSLWVLFTNDMVLLDLLCCVYGITIVTIIYLFIIYMKWQFVLIDKAAIVVPDNFFSHNLEDKFVKISILSIVVTTVLYNIVLHLISGNILHLHTSLSILFILFVSGLHRFLMKQLLHEFINIESELLLNRTIYN